jgi:hypothetical protein
MATRVSRWLPLIRISRFKYDLVEITVEIPVIHSSQRKRAPVGCPPPKRGACREKRVAAGANYMKLAGLEQ